MEIFRGIDMKKIIVLLIKIMNNILAFFKFRIKKIEYIDNFNLTGISMTNIGVATEGYVERFKYKYKIERIKK